MLAVAPLTECVQAGEEALAIAREIQWRPGEAFAMIGLAFAWHAHGEYGQALALAPASAGPYASVATRVGNGG